MATLAAATVVLTFRKDAADRKEQAFEQNFYTLLKNLESIVSNTTLNRLKQDTTGHTTATYPSLQDLELSVVDQSYVGRRALNVFVCLIRDGIDPPGYNNIKIVSEAYDAVFDNYVGVLGPFFRTLYHAVKLIDERCTGNKQHYIRVIRAQLGNSELCLLAYNCCVGEGRFKFKPLVEQYSLLHNLHRKGLDPHAEAELEFFQRKMKPNAFRFEDIPPITYDD